MRRPGEPRAENRASGVGARPPIPHPGPHPARRAGSSQPAVRPRSPPKRPRARPGGQHPGSPASAPVMGRCRRFVMVGGSTHLFPALPELVAHPARPACLPARGEPRPANRLADPRAGAPPIGAPPFKAPIRPARAPPKARALRAQRTASRGFTPTGSRHQRAKPARVRHVRAEKSASDQPAEKPGAQAMMFWSSGTVPGQSSG